VVHITDLDLTAKEVTDLASPDTITAFLTELGHDTADRTALSPEAVGLSGESAGAIKKIELLSEDPEQFLRVVFAQPKSLTAKVRNDLVRILGKSNVDHMLVLASDFENLEFDFLDKRKKEQKGPVAGERIHVVPKTINVSRRNPTRLDLRTMRRFTWTCKIVRIRCGKPPEATAIFSSGPRDPARKRAPSRRRRSTRSSEKRWPGEWSAYRRLP
jgi:hypothetical protein